jgi:hypothetical protein
MKLNSQKLQQLMIATAVASGLVSAGVAASAQTTAASASTPPLASAQSVVYSTKSPVAIASFSVNESYESAMRGGEAQEAPEFIASDITLTFVNKSNVPATTVTFLVNDGQYTQSIVDKGTFSPGVQIKHDFAVDSRVSTLGNATLNVTEVDFADGSVWHSAPGDVANR